MSTSLLLSDVKILRNGADGSHLYIRGRGDFPAHGACEIYAFFRSKEDERRFERQYSGQAVLVEGGRTEFTAGIGGYIWDIDSWSFA